MLGFLRKNDVLLFWTAFVILSFICYGGFTYMFSRYSPPTEAELILKIK